MKNLILKWLGLHTIVADVELLEANTDDVIRQLVRDNLDDVKYDIQNDVKYELEDDFLSEDDAISKFEQVLEENDLLDVASKMQRVDDRMTELVAGYKLEVQLVKEDF
tara:strand:- start:525 stop:848 length:324 start_codon:yes stop_codon:yes gene_type:complete